MVILPRTVLSQLRFRSVFRHALAVLDNITEQAGIDNDTMLVLLFDYCNVVARVQFDDEPLGAFVVSASANEADFYDAVGRFLNAPPEIADAFWELAGRLREADEPKVEEHKRSIIETDDPN